MRPRRGWFQARFRLGDRRSICYERPVPTGLSLLKFRCTQCGNCCKDPILPLTDADVKRIVKDTGHAATDIIRWVDRNAIDMDDEPEAFVMLRQGKRIMTMRQGRGGCRYLGADDRCTIYSIRPLGCRAFPFDPTFKRDGTLRRLKLIEATECPYELDGQNDVDAIRKLHERYDAATDDYQQKVAEWNRLQRRRRRQGKAAQTTREFLDFLGIRTAPAAKSKSPYRPARARA